MAQESLTGRPQACRAGQRRQAARERTAVPGSASRAAGWHALQRLSALQQNEHGTCMACQLTTTPSSVCRAASAWAWLPKRTTAQPLHGATTTESPARICNQSGDGRHCSCPHAPCTTTGALSACIHPSKEAHASSGRQSGGFTIMLALTCWCHLGASAP